MLPVLRRESLECLVKQFRGLIGQAGWEKEEESVAFVAERAGALLRAHAPLADLKKADLYAARSLLRSALRGCDAVYKDSVHRRALALLLEQAEGQYAAL